MTAYFGMYAATLFIFLLNKASPRFVLNTAKKSIVKPRPTGTFALILLSIPSTVLACLRWYVGNDYKMYINCFNSILYNKSFRDETVQLEVGFKLFIRAITFFTSNYIWLFVLSALLINFAVVAAIVKLSPDKQFSFIIFIVGQFFFHSLTGVRQWFVVAVFIYTLSFIEAKKPIPYIVILCLCSLIHSSALFLLPFYILLFFEYSNKQLFWILGIGVAAYPLVFGIFTRLIERTKYAFYVDSVYGNSNFALAEFIITTIVVILGFMYRKDSNRLYSILLASQIFDWLLILYSNTIFLADRVIWYFSAIQIVFVPLIIRNISRKRDRYIVCAVLVSLYFASTLYVFFYQKQGSIVPYQTFL